VPPDILAKYFVAEPAGTYAVRDSIKSRITFKKHDLLSDPYPSDIDLILCRNVVIYFTEEAKSYIYSGFANALRPGGLLFVGGSEMIMRSHDIGLRLDGVSFYRRNAA
jgi:chemotaxis protein methyltransferase CheR